MINSRESVNVGSTNLIVSCLLVLARVPTQEQLELSVCGQWFSTVLGLSLEKEEIVWNLKLARKHLFFSLRVKA